MILKVKRFCKTNGGSYPQACRHACGSIPFPAAGGGAAWRVRGDKAEAQPDEPSAGRATCRRGCYNDRVQIVRDACCLSMYKEYLVIDRIIVPASVHVWVGMLVVSVTLLAMVYTAFLAWRGRALSRLGRGILLATQLVLMAQALVGIKLLDQGAGPLQLYIHYIGGLAPLAFFMAMAWWPARQPRTQRWVTTLVTSGAFVFALMTFVIGQAYVRGTL